MLASEGCNVFFCGRSEGPIAHTVEGNAEPPGRVVGAQVDATDMDSFERWLRALGDFDIFIPNVSALASDWESAIAVDIRGTIAATEAAIPHLQRSRHAAITYIGSKAASLAAPRSAAYGAAKAAMAHYMKSLALQLLPAVRVNTVSPGDTWVAGGFWDRVRQNDPAAFATGGRTQSSRAARRARRDRKGRGLRIESGRELRRRRQLVRGRGLGLPCPVLSGDLKALDEQRALPA